MVLFRFPLYIWQEGVVILLSITAGTTVVLSLKNQNKNQTWAFDFVYRPLKLGFIFVSPWKADSLSILTKAGFRACTFICQFPNLGQFSFRTQQCGTEAFCLGGTWTLCVTHPGQWSLAVILNASMQALQVHSPSSTAACLQARLHAGHQSWMCSSYNVELCCSISDVNISLIS